MTTTRDITIFIAEDHPISLMGLKMMLEETAHFKIIGEAEDGRTAIDMVLAQKPDIVMMDLGLPEVDGIEATARIKEKLPGTRVLIFTAAEETDTIFEALSAGADGYCTKNIAKELLASAVHSVMEGAAWLDPAIAHKVLRAQRVEKKEGNPEPAPAAAVLTDSKLHLLGLIEQGKSFDEISKDLNINDSLVKGLLNELMKQLQGNDGTVVSSKVQSGGTLREGDLVAEHYKIEEQLGFGGMGSVLKARHTQIARTVAIKTMHEHLAANDGTRARFINEAEATMNLSHPHLVRIFDFGVHNERIPYMVMEYLEGESLSDLLDRVEKLDVPTASRIFKQVCDALYEVHKNGIVHRDLKPSNIMLTRNGSESNYVKLVDFGIAKALEDTGKALTLTGEAIGSPPYMSPEQCSGSKIGHQSDIYSLGCVMYETFTGLWAFGPGSPFDIMLKHMNEMPSREPFSADGNEIPGEIVDIMFKMLAKNPAERPSSAQEVGQVLSRFTNET